MISLEAVVVTALYGDAPPWPVDASPPGHLVSLGAHTPPEQAGAVVAQLAEYNKVGMDGTAGDVVGRILAEESLLLPGGVRVRGGAGEITPGCCCGLDDWREWIGVEEHGESPWMGHDPDPWIERADGVLRVWSDGGLAGPDEPRPRADAADVFHIDIPAADYPCLVEGVRRDLLAFLDVLRRWGAEHCPSLADALAERFDQEFGVTADRSPDVHETFP